MGSFHDQSDLQYIPESEQIFIGNYAATKVIVIFVAIMLLRKGCLVLGQLASRRLQHDVELEYQVCIQLKIV